MKLSNSHIVDKSLRKLGSSPNNLQIPSILDEQYTDLWQTFIKTPEVLKLIKNYTRKESIYLITAGFISVLELFTKLVDIHKLTHDYSFSVFKRTPINNWFDTRTFNKGLRLHNHEIYVGYATKNLLNAIYNIKVEGVIIFKMEGRRSLDGFLNSSKLFRKVPKQLLPKKRYPRIEQINSVREDQWYIFDTKLPVDVKLLRVKFSTLVLKYSMSLDTFIFKGSTSETKIKDKIKHSLKRNFKI